MSEKNNNENNSMSEIVHFYKVGELRKALEGLPDDRLIVCQVVAKDGKAWNMQGGFCPKVPQGTIACLTFKHHQLETLP